MAAATSPTQTGATRWRPSPGTGTGAAAGEQGEQAAAGAEDVGAAQDRVLQAGGGDHALDLGLGGQVGVGRGGPGSRRRPGSRRPPGGPRRRRRRPGTPGPARPRRRTGPRPGGDHRPPVSEQAVNTPSMAAARPSGSVASSSATLAPRRRRPGRPGRARGPRPGRARRPGAGARPPRPARPARPRRSPGSPLKTTPCRHDMDYSGQRPGLPECPKGRIVAARSSYVRNRRARSSARDQADPGEGQRQGQGQLRPPQGLGRPARCRWSATSTTGTRSSTRSARAATAPRASPSPSRSRSGSPSATWTTTASWLDDDAAHEYVDNGIGGVNSVIHT